MAIRFPTPADVGIRIPRHLRPERFRAGFAHALRGGQIDQVEFLRLSFREGFRAAKLFLREERKHRGTPAFPMRGRIRMRAI